MKLLRDESGQVLVLTVVCMGGLGFMAPAIDVGQLLYTKRQFQTVADATAHAAALEIQQCGGTANCAAMQNAAKSAVTENGLASFTVLKQCAATSGTGFAAVVNNDPCTLSANDPNYNDTRYAEAVVSQERPTIFARIPGVNPVTVAARSEAGLAPPQFCLDVLNPTARGALLMNGNATLNANCGIIVDSSASMTLLVNGHDTLSATAIHVYGGGWKTAVFSVSPTPTQYAQATPGIDTNSVSVTTTWPGTTPDCTKNCGICAPANSQGCLVKVQVSYHFSFILPFLLQSALNFSGTSEKTIQE